MERESREWLQVAGEEGEAGTFLPRATPKAPSKAGWD